MGHEIHAQAIKQILQMKITRVRLQYAGIQARNIE